MMCDAFSMICKILGEKKSEFIWKYPEIMITTERKIKLRDFFSLNLTKRMLARTLTSLSDGLYR